MSVPESLIANPRYFAIVEPLLRFFGRLGNVSAFLRLYPNFDPEAVPLPDLNQPTYALEASYLQRACRVNHINAVRGLLQCGASLLSTDCRGRFTLWHACIGMQESRVNMVLWLLAEYADARATVNWADDGGVTPLHNAVDFGSIGLILVLLRFGAGNSLGMLNSFGNSPIDAAENKVSKVALNILKAAQRTQAVLIVGEWRPRKHAQFPLKYRIAMRVLVVLARARTRKQRDLILDADGSPRILSRYPQSCLDLLPEELLQHLFAYVTATPLPLCWTNGIPWMTLFE
jgi:hypothetical protein